MGQYLPKTFTGKTLRHLCTPCADLTEKKLDKKVDNTAHRNLQLKKKSYLIDEFIKQVTL